MISGGIKFFDENAALLDNGGACVASTGIVVEQNCIDKLAYTYWTSVGSNDSTQETLTITFGSTSISRLLLLDHNWKNYTVKYWNGTTWADFTSVSGLDGALGGGIAETTFADNSSYYEFATVTTTQLQIKINSTQAANAEKYIATVMATNELGTLQGYPKVDPVTYTRTVRTMQMLSGRSRMVKQPEVFSCTLKLANYPVLTYGADLDLLASLIDRESPFYIWLCGGRRNTSSKTYFSYAVRGWRLKDCPRVQIDSDLAQTWTDNIYTSGQGLGDLVFSEHV